MAHEDSVASSTSGAHSSDADAHHAQQHHHAHLLAPGGLLRSLMPTPVPSPAPVADTRDEVWKAMMRPRASFPALPVAVAGVSGGAPESPGGQVAAEAEANASAASAGPTASGAWPACWTSGSRQSSAHNVVLKPTSA